MANVNLSVNNLNKNNKTLNNNNNNNNSNKNNMNTTKVIAGIVTPIIPESKNANNEVIINAPNEIRIDIAGAPNNSNNSNNSNSNNNNSGIQLRLGDIIQLSAPGIIDLDQQILFVEFLNPQKMVFKNVETLEKKTLRIEENGDLEEKGILEIALLSRANEEGYAKQNGLIPGQWVNIEFSGDIPFIVVGEIMNLEEDMIEVKSYPDGKTIYIDFAYQGIPEDLPIESIEKRSPPEEEKPEEEVIEEVAVQLPDNDNADELIDDNINIESQQLDEIILDADEIFIGEDLGSIQQEVELDKRQMRYGLQNQVDDMLDEMLASIPEAKRTRSVINNIHLTIERFKQLRGKYSVFDDNGNAMLPIQKTANYKPLVNALVGLKQNLHWLLPVATNKKFLYDVDEDEAEGVDDIIATNLGENFTQLTTALDDYYKNNVPDGENKQKYFDSVVNRYWSPFTAPEEYKRSGVLGEQKVETDDGSQVTAVINNFDDYNSSVAKEESIINKKYQLTPYTHGEKMSIKSLVMLPEYAFKYAQAYLPETSILNKSSYSAKDFFVYTLLRKNAFLSTVDVKQDEDTKYDPDTFLKNIIEIVPDDSEDVEKDYRAFLEQAIPKTRVFFQLIKKYITNNVSFYDIVHNLEPFMVYHDDITYKQYQEMTKFISEKIMDYKKNVQKKAREFKFLHFGKKFAKRTKRPIFDIMNQIKNDQGEKMGNMLLVNTDSLKYNIPFRSFKRDEFNRDADAIRIPIYTSSEILNSIYEKDGGVAFYLTIAKDNAVKLTSNDDLSQIVKRIKVETENEIQEKEIDNSCKATRIVKVYESLDSLLADNDIEVYHDNKLDETRYDIIENYEEERKTMDDKEFKQFLITELENNIGLNTIEAVRDAEAMIYGKRPVIDGEYCVLNDKDTNRSFYYKRVGNAWQRNENVFSSNFEDQRMICNLRDDCVTITDEQRKNQGKKKGRIVKNPKKESNGKICTDEDLAEAMLEESAMNKLIQAFNIDMEVSRNDLIQLLTNRSEIMIWRLALINIVDNDKKYYINDKHLQYGKALALEGGPTVIESPNAVLLDRIMGESDIVKRNRNINDFVYYATVRANEDNGESPHWLYCKQTGVKLLPLFVSDLSNAFNRGPSEYYEKVEELCATIGVMSDDGEAWVDKHSGYIIKKIDFDTEEGFEEGGFKKVSREIMEADLTVQTSVQEKKYTDPRGQMTNNVITSMASFMGINIEPVRDFIIQQTLIMIEKLLPPEAEYKKKMEALEKKGKRAIGYETALNTALLMMALAYFHVAVLTMVPSVRTKKQFPGCVKSFTGYPLTGTEDIGGLAYVACVANKIKSSTAPWVVMKRMNEKSIMKRIKDNVDKYLLKNEDIQERIRMKLEHLTLEDGDQVPEEISLLKWQTFLPPLTEDYKTIKIDSLSQVFLDEFEKQVRKGDKGQYKNVGVIEGKAMHYSQEIISHIQRIIQKELPLLKNNADEPFLENSCCIESGYDALGYFTKRSKDILVKNDTVRKLEHVLYNFRHVVMPQMFAIVGKNNRVFPTVTDTFREPTIYTAFIHYCNYESVLPVPDPLFPVCGAKPSTPMGPIDHLDERIAALKAEGKNYTSENLTTILRIIAERNVKDVDFDPVLLSTIEKLRILLANVEPDDTFMSNILLKTLHNLAQSIDPYKNKMYKLETYSAPLKEVINEFTKKTESMKTSIRDYIRIHSSLTKRKKEDAMGFLDSIFAWDTVIDMDFGALSTVEEGVDKSIYLLELVAQNDSAYERVFSYCENLIHRLAKTIPSIIINNVDFDDQTIVRHWRLSDRHSSDISKLIQRNYEGLAKFYEAPHMKSILKKVIQHSNNLLKLTATIPLYNNNIVNGTEVHHDFDKSLKVLLLEFIIMKLFSLYIMFTDQPDLLAEKLDQEEKEEGIGAIVSNLVQDTEIGEIEEIEIVTGRVAAVSVKIADLFVEMCAIFGRDKKTINYNHQEIIDRVKVSKEKEKDLVTERLKDLSDEERQVDNILKAHKLGQWNKGLLKGLTQYVPGTYDEERAVMEAQAELEQRLGKDDRVTAMNREIYAADLVDAEMVGDEIEAEEMDLAHLGDDDDHGDMDGDEYY